LGEEDVGDLRDELDIEDHIIKGVTPNRCPQESRAALEALVDEHHQAPKQIFAG
jgi:DnaJ-domain-containing protein 1